MRCFKFAAMLFAALLAGCGPIYETMYDYTSPATSQGQLCASQCTQVSMLCRQNCDLDEQRCLADERARGAREYERYVHRQEDKGEAIDKSLDDFTNTYRCNSARSCKDDCVVPYNQCFTGCGGNVTSRQVCTAFCD